MTIKNHMTIIFNVSLTICQSIEMINTRNAIRFIKFHYRWSECLILISTSLTIHFHFHFRNVCNRSTLNTTSRSMCSAYTVFISLYCTLWRSTLLVSRFIGSFRFQYMLVSSVSEKSQCICFISQLCVTLYSFLLHADVQLLSLSTKSFIQ